MEKTTMEEIDQNFNTVINEYLVNQGIVTQSGIGEHTRINRQFIEWCSMAHLNAQGMKADDVIRFATTSQWNSVSRQATITSIVTRFIGWVWGYDHPAAKARVSRPGTRSKGKKETTVGRSIAPSLPLDAQLSAQAIDEFLACNSHSLSTEETYRFYLTHFSQWIRKNQLNLTTLKAADVYLFVESQTWGESAQYVCCCAVRNYMTVRFGETHDAAKASKPKPKPTPQRTLTTQQAKAISSRLEGNAPIKIRNRAIFWLLLDAGFREFEVADILLKDVDLANLMVGVYTKGGKFGWGKFSSQTANDLRDWLKVRPMCADKDIKTLFVSMGGGNTGKPMTREAVKGVVRDICGEEDLRISPHDLRRAFAVILVEANTPTDEIAELGRWEDDTNVKRYAQKAQNEPFRCFMPGSDVNLGNSQ